MKLTDHTHLNARTVSGIIYEKEKSKCYNSYKKTLNIFVEAFKNLYQYKIRKKTFLLKMLVTILI